MDNLKEIVSERINFLIRSNHLTQKAFAYKCGLATAIVNKATKGELSINSALQISNAMGCSLDFLYGKSTSQSSDHYALEVLQEHFQPCQEVSICNDSVVEAHISVSLELAKFIDAISELQAIKRNDNLRKLGESEAKDEFLRVIAKQPEDFKKYILLDPLIYTNEVKAAIEKAKADIAEGTSE